MPNTLLGDGSGWWEEDYQFLRDNYSFIGSDGIEFRVGEDDLAFSCPACDMVVWRGEGSRLGVGDSIEHHIRQEH